MKRYVKHFVLWLIVIFSIFSLVKADSPPPPWSEVIQSNNGKYILVLISPKVKQQEEYVIQSREFWRKGGISAENIPEAEKDLQKEIAKEAEIRKKYVESGLYTVGKSPKLLWKIDLYDLNSWKKVSDDGEHVITGKLVISGITEEKPLEYNPEIKKVVKIYPDMEENILTFYSSGKLLRSYKTSDLIDSGENLQANASNNFLWSNEGILNEKTKTLSITRKNGDELIFDINGNLLRRKLANQPSNTGAETDTTKSPESENKRSFCGGIALFFGLILSLLFGR